MASVILPTIAKTEWIETDMLTAFPSDPTARKAILVLGQHDFERCEYDPKGAEALTDDEIFVLPYPVQVDDTTPQALRSILSHNIARPGDLLVQSPFDLDEYAPAALAPERFALDKHMNVSLLCQLLGAKSFRVEQIDLQTSNGKASVELKGAKGPINVSGGVEIEQLDTFKNQMSVDVAFGGSAPNIEAAESLLQRTGLWSDPKLRALVQMRRERENVLLSHKIVISLSSEVQSNLRIAARAKIPSFVNISADCKKSLVNRNEYTVTTEITF